MKFIVGKKLDMTQIWRDDEVVPVTRVQAGPCVVIQIKDKDKDGYEAVQIGFDKRKEKNINKPQKNHIKKAGHSVDIAYLREFRTGETEKDIKAGDIIDVSTFGAGDKVKVTGTSKGRGFQGVVRRHGFAGQSKTHGTKDQLRMPGSIGATGPAHVFKGTRMPGRMGGDRTTVANLEIVDVDKDNNILLIKGAVPGPRNGLILIQGEGELKVVSPKDAKEAPSDAKDDKPKDATPDVGAQNLVPDEAKEKAAPEENTKKSAPEEDIEEVVVEADKKRQEK